MPSDVEVVEGTLLAWPEASDDDGLTFRGGDDLLPAFLGLATAEPEQMAEFMYTYGVPELCVHGRPDRHPDPRRRGAYCATGHLDDGRPFIASADVRRAAIAFGAGSRAALALAARTLPDPAVWVEMSHLQVPVGRGGVATWQDGRTELAAWFTGLMSDCGVAVVADWSDPRLRIEPEADGLLGTLILLLGRELGQGDRYRCDVCGVPVDRVRPPKTGERVYCSKPACRREQQRRNQAAWRRRKREESEDL